MALLGFGALFSTEAAAQSNDRALAEQLFRNAQDLMRVERYAEACPKLAESQRLDPGTGTLLNLAVCHEREGKLASAWAEYNDVVTLARRDQRADRVQYAEQRIAAIEPKLSRLSIELAPGADVPGLEIRLDGERLGSAALGVAAPADPGQHTVSASAPGKRSWEHKLEIAAGPAQQSVLVPQLADAPQTPSSAPNPGSPAHGSASTRNTQRISGYALGALGVVGVGVGSYFGLRAIAKNKQSNEEGCSGNLCTEDAAATRRSAASAGTISTVAFLAGGAALATGVVLLLTAPRAAESRPAAGVWLAPGVARIDLGASF